VLLGASEASRAGYVFTAIDFPGAPTTLALGINDAGLIVGIYFDTSGIEHGFLKSGSSLTPIDVPGSTFTQVDGINDVGQIVGGFGDSTGFRHGFLKSGSSFTQLDVPGATVFTEAIGINDAGLIVGAFSDTPGVEHGFLKSGSSYTAIDVPGAVTTDVLGINDAGQIVGRFGFGTGEPGFRFGFLNSGSSFTTIDFPGGARAIQANGIDAAGRIVGNYSEPEGIVSPCNLTESMDTGVGPACTNQASSLLHAYLLEGSSFTQLDFPGAIGTLGIGINDAGVIVGGFFDSTGTLHGYVANPVPEPSTWALTTIGALILLVYIRHDRLQIHRGRH